MYDEPDVTYKPLITDIKTLKLVGWWQAERKIRLPCCFHNQRVSFFKEAQYIFSTGHCPKSQKLIVETFEKSIFIHIK